MILINTNFTIFAGESVGNIGQDMDGVKRERLQGAEMNDLRNT